VNNAAVRDMHAHYSSSRLSVSVRAGGRCRNDTAVASLLENRVLGVPNKLHLVVIYRYASIGSGCCMIVSVGFLRALVVLLVPLQPACNGSTPVHSLQGYIGLPPGVVVL
jgi:hypothetical protein